MNIKETAHQIASVNMKNKCSHAELEDFAEALVAELAKGNEPVARICSGWQLLFIGSDSIAEVARKHSLKIGDALYTLPPTAEQIEQETAEAIAKMLHSNANKCYLTSDAFVLKANASLIIDGAWKEYK